MGSRLTIILLVIALAEYYCFMLMKSVVRDLPAPWKLGVMVGYLAITITVWLGLFFFRQINWDNVPHLLRNIYIAFVLGLVVGKVLVLLVMLIDDIRRVLTWALEAIAGHSATAADGKAATIDRSVFLKRAALLLAGLSITGFVFGVSNRYKYRVRKIKLKFPTLPPSFRGLKIVQLSDIHTGSFDNHAAVAHGIDRAMDQKADLIFFTGDLVNNTAHEVDEHYQEIFSRLKAPMGVFSTLGNHDYGDYVQWPSPEDKVRNLDRLKALHGTMGWRLLMNEHVVFQRGADTLAVIGIENWGAKAHFPKYGDMARACVGLKEGAFQVLLSHDPSHWDAQVLPEYPNVSLTLSGHTHGMQFGIESKWLKWSPVQYLYKQWAGAYWQGNQALYVNRGFGFLGYPGRLGILPEITVIELV